MKNLIACIALSAILGQGLSAQTEPFIIKPDTGQTDYSVNASSGEVRLLATDSIILLPNTIIESGSNFVARIIGNPDNEFGITINTTNLPSSDFEIVAGSLVLENLVSGTEDSEVFVETGPDIGEGNFVLINVDPATNNAGLNLRISKSQDVYSVEVFQQGTWAILSSKFYEVVDDKITFFKNEIRKAYPFDMNLVNGVEYDRSGALTLSINQLINVSGGSLQITGPNNFSTTINPNVSDNNFIWDGSQATPGVYQFKLQLQGKLFNGQFLIL